MSAEAKAELKEIHRLFSDIIFSQEGLWIKMGELYMEDDYMETDGVVSQLEKRLDRLESFVGKTEETVRLRSLLNSASEAVRALS